MSHLEQKLITFFLDRRAADQPGAREQLSEYLDAGWKIKELRTVGGRGREAGGWVVTLLERPGPEALRLTASDRLVDVSDTRSLRREIDVPAAAGDVWHTYASASGWADFFGVEARIELRPGGAFEIYFDPEAEAGKQGSEGCQVLSYLPSRLLTHSWNAPPSFPELRDEATWVVVEVEPTGAEESRVVLTHLGWGEDGRWEELYAYFDQAWQAVLEKLKEHFEG